jgi:hypothetical protein
VNKLTTAIRALLGGFIAAFITFIVVALWVGPFLLPNEFVTDTGPNISSPFLWGLMAIAFVVGIVLVVRDVI